MNALPLQVRAALSTPTADNSQGHRLNLTRDTIQVAYRPHPGIDLFGPDGHATLIAFGALAHNALTVIGADQEQLAIAPRGADTILTLPRRDLPSDRGHPLFARHTNRFPYRHDAVPTDLQATLSSVTRPRVRLRLLTPGKSATRLIEVTRQCCQARFSNRELHEWLMGSLRFTPEEVARGDGLDIHTLHLPPFGAAFMRFIRPWSTMERLNRWFRIYKTMAATEVALLGKAPLIACVVGEDSRDGAFEAGRLMQQTWIRANNEGLAVHPYYVVADQQTRLNEGRLPPEWEEPVGTAIEELPQLLEFGKGERLHMMLRVGRPVNKAPVRSRRLPESKLVSGLPAG